MPTLDLQHGLAPGLGPPDEVVVAFFRAFLPDFYFVNTPISRMRRHLQLIGDLRAAPLLLDFHQAVGANFTELTLCAGDDAQPGLLSKVAGTLSALKINIDTAWIHTLRDPHDVESGRRVVLDTLILSESGGGAGRPLSAKTQARVREILTPILSGQSSALPSLAKILRRASPLVIEEISTAPDADGTLQITLRAADAEAVLFRITRVLASLGLDIAHAQINTFERSIDDVFFVSKSGGAAIEADQIPGLLELLRHALENENFAA